MRHYGRLFCLLSALFLTCNSDLFIGRTGFAKEPQASDLMDWNLEDLMEVRVTSVSKRPESYFSAAAAIYVITQEELQRQGVNNVPEALRFVPGLNVARQDAHTWAITSRGFNGELASKLLVLIDGRSVYTPLFSGVRWDIQDLVIGDIDRIEVIRGPGGTLWGANAVNGIINVITKPSRDTQGWQIASGGGTEERAFGSIRYGGELAEGVSFRIFGKYFDRDESFVAPGDPVLPSGGSAQDRWNLGHGGFRVDWLAANENKLTMQGDIYQGREHQSRAIVTGTGPLTVAVGPFVDDVTGGNLLGRWTHDFTDTSNFQLQAYYDRTKRENALPEEIRDTFDIDFQHRSSPFENQDIVWGFGYRLSSDEVTDGVAVSFAPDDRTTHLYNVFVQDEITVIPDRFQVTLGSKFEHNDFTGLELQPSLRFAWFPSNRQTVWAAVSRAIRTPSRAEDDIVINLPTGATIFGAKSGVSEELIAYELGYRVYPLDQVSLDLATFYNVYDRLRNLEPIPLSTFAVSANNLEGESHGIEAVATWQVTNWCRIQAQYSYIRLALHSTGSLDPITEPTLEGNTPRNQFSIRSALDLPEHIYIDTSIRYVDVLRNPTISSYLVADIQLRWQPTNNWEFSVVGQNLLDNKHPEFATSLITTPQTEIEQSVYAKVTWRY